MKEITEEMLASLSEQIFQQMSPKRFAHTLAVEEMVARLCNLFCPEYTMEMRAAALLHDITKEWDNQKQENFCLQNGLLVTNAERQSPKTFHARTAAILIPLEYSAFSTPTVLSAVRWHTTGREKMSLCERLLYLADYIDTTRIFESCVILRRYFWGANPSDMTVEERLSLLRDTLILSFQFTIRDLLEERKVIAEDTFKAFNSLLLEASVKG